MFCSLSTSVLGWGFCHIGCQNHCHKDFAQDDDRLFSKIVSEKHAIWIFVLIK